MKITPVFSTRTQQRRMAHTFRYHPKKATLPRPDSKTITKGIKILLAAGIVLLLGLCAYKGFCRSTFFQLTSISIQGCTHTGKDRILELSGIDIHSNLLALQTDLIKEAIAADPWIDSVRIIKKWPNQLIINIEEKKPLALINRKDGLYYIDNNGRPFAPVVAGGELDFPVLTGRPFLSLPVKSGPCPSSPLQDALAFLKYAHKSNPILPRQNISEIHARKNGELILFLLDQAFPIHLGLDDMHAKYNMLVKVLKGLYKKGEISDTAYIHVDYRPDQVLVGMKKSGARTRG